MNILFLDIDGVLNSRKYFVEGANKNEPWPFSTIDFKALSLLSDFVLKNNLEIVLTSSWRVIYSLKEINDFFLKNGFCKPIIDKTLRIWWPIKEERYRFERGNEIKVWLNNQTNVKKFVIFDDDIDLEPYLRYHVWVNRIFGLCELNLRLAEEILYEQY